jgi:hypothetical protein
VLGVRGGVRRALRVVVVRAGVQGMEGGGIWIVKEEVDVVAAVVVEGVEVEEVEVAGEVVIKESFCSEAAQLEVV